MPFAAALSTHATTPTALREVCEQAGARLGTRPDLAVLFFSPHHAAQAEALAASLHERLGPRCALGCAGEAIVGTGQEVEDGPALSLWLGQWRQGVELDAFHLTLEQTPDGYSLMGGPDSLLQADPAHSTLLLLGDPYSFPVEGFLRQLHGTNPGLRVVGGMASGAGTNDETRLLLGEGAPTSGAVGVLLRGDVRVRSIVSQGCRPIGQPFVITRAQENLIFDLGGKGARARLQEVWEGLDAHDRDLLRRGLHIGRVINEYRSDFQRGDFLVRNVVGIDQATGALVITDRVRVGQTVQFHVRDAATADEDLHALLQMDLAAHTERPQGALLFTCNGRGTRLFPAPNHDARVLAEEAGPLPVAGFFAQGELGPVGGLNFIHGFTASVVFFE
jgi:small ligand-binding sensory domain FIST